MPAPYFTLCTSEAIVIKGGANASSTAIASAAILQQFSNDAEGFVCTATRFDWITNYSAVASFAKLLLADATSNLAGKQLIAYDMSGYTGRGEAEDMINVLHDRALDAITLLKNYKRPEVEA